MQKVKAIKSVIAHALAATAALGLLTFAMLTFAAPHAQATPALAKGQPCTVCHEGKPPNKTNLNDKGKATQSGMKK